MSDICLSLVLLLSLSPPVLDVRLPLVFLQSNHQWGNITSFLTCHEWNEDAIFSVFFFFFIRKVGQEHEDFLKRQNDRETQRGERGNEMCKQESFHHICDVLFCLFAGQPSFPRTSSAFCEENRQPTGGQTLSLCYFLPCSFFSTYIYISVCVTAIRK